MRLIGPIAVTAPAHIGASGVVFRCAKHPPLPQSSHASSKNNSPLTPEQEEMFRAEMDRMMEEWRTRPVDPDAVARAMTEQRGRVARMMNWLDMAPTPPVQSL